MGRPIALAGLAGLLAAPAFLIAPASAAIAFTCDSVAGSAVISPGLVHDTRPQSLSSGPTAPAGPADIRVVSTSDAGVKGNGVSDVPSLSGDGSKVAFMSVANNLDPADSDTNNDVYVKNLDTGNLTLASTSDTGAKANNNNFSVSLSTDGTKLAFHSRATNLDPVDTDTLEDVYVKNLSSGNVDLASTSDTGVKSSSSALFPSLSSDGTKVAFASDSSNLDPADAADYDVYVKDLTTGDITLASTSDAGVKGNSSSGVFGGDPWLSADGTKVAFGSSATNLDPADTDSGVDVYVKNLTTGDIALASSSDAGVRGNNGSVWPSMSTDGSTVSFESGANNFDPADADGHNDVYVKNLITGDITLASTSDAGIKSNSSNSEPALSADGTRVAFSSTATNLDPADTNTSWSLYVKDLGSGDITLASTTDNGVRGNLYSFGASLSADNTDVAFYSSGNILDPADTDISNDVYFKELPTVPTSIAISDCSNGNSGTASIVDIRSYGPRPLGCPQSNGGAAGNDYPDTTPILVGTNPTFTIDWATGPNSSGVAAAKAGPTGTQWRFRLAITASPGHDTPATNQYLPAAGSGATKTRLQGKFDVSALDSFNCTSGVSDPLSWLSLANNGIWVAKTS
jgi:Tol biopolymer transport system component